MYTKVIALSVITMFASAGALAGEDLPANALPMSKVLQNIQKEGFNVIKKIEFNDGKYEAKAINNAGNEIKLEIAPQTGELLKPKDEAAPKLSIFEAVSKVEAAGYKNIYKVDSSKDKYEIKAYDSNNKKVTLDVDGNTGAIKD